MAIVSKRAAIQYIVYVLSVGSMSSSPVQKTPLCPEQDITVRGSDMVVQGEITGAACLQRTVEAALFEIGEDLALSAGNEWNDPWVGMFGDVLLRRLILHFLLCRAALALHNDYSQVDDYQPTCFPPLPQVSQELCMGQPALLRIAYLE